MIGSIGRIFSGVIIESKGHYHVLGTECRLRVMVSKLVKVMLEASHINFNKTWFAICMTLE